MNIKTLNRQCRLTACLFLALVFCSGLHGQNAPDFPGLSGRIVDQTGLLDAETRAKLDQQLAAHESETSNQIVVVTVNSLEGLDIADYALQLGRHWGIGTSDKNNGVVFLIAPNERKARIEVGYGLEGALPDGLAGNILRHNILPSFREDDYPGGIDKGVSAILEAIRGEYTPPANAVTKRDGVTNTLERFIPLFFIAFIGLSHALRRVANRRVANASFPSAFAGLFLALGTGNVLIGIAAAIGIFAFLYFASGSGGSGSGRHKSGGHMGGGRIGGGSGGGFSGGGGGFGGGGASGSW